MKRRRTPEASFQKEAYLSLKGVDKLARIDPMIERGIHEADCGRALQERYGQG